jgi:hypothetical protein
LSPRSNDAQLRAIARRELELKRNTENPFHYIFKTIQSKDEHDVANPIKHFPDKEYLRELLKVWHEGHSVEFLIKSRQLMVTWLAIAYISWVARYHEHRLIFVQSKKEEDAANLVFNTHPSQARLSFIETHLPKWMQQDVTWAYGKAIYPNGSRVQAIPQGPTHYESYVPSLVFNDEASLQDEWQAGHAALRPCIEGGGKCITVATVRMPSHYSEEMREEEGARKTIIGGLDRYTSASGVSATALHYSADPAKNPATKQGRVWYDAATAGYPGGIEGHLWRQHMELDFEAVSGTKLIPFWDKHSSEWIISPKPRSQQIGWRYDAGFDYGKRNFTCFGVYATDPRGFRYLVWELAAPGDQLGGVPGIAARMLRCPYWEDVSHNIKADPTLWNDNQARMAGGYTSLAHLFALEGVYMQRAPLKGQAADEIAIDRLLYHYLAEPTEPRLFMFKNCVEHIRQFKGLRYREWSTGVEPTRALKEELVDKHNDCWDAWKYSECARPSPAQFVTRAREGSFESLRRSLAAAVNRPGPKARAPRA